jgi:hypothetical protein
MASRGWTLLLRHYADKLLRHYADKFEEWLDAGVCRFFSKTTAI